MVSTIENCHAASRVNQLGFVCHFGHRAYGNKRGAQEIAEDDLRQRIEERSRPICKVALKNPDDGTGTRLDFREIFPLVIRRTGGKSSILRPQWRNHSMFKNSYTGKIFADF